MQTENEIEIRNETIKLWKELNIYKCEMEFSCGGDSMTDYDFVFYNNKDKKIECKELKDFFEDEVFKRVEFYVNSDGYYMGEYGSVTITLDEDDDEPYFSYDKQAVAEWEETFTDTMYVELSDKESDVLKKVSNINGRVWDNESNINYQNDCVITDEESQTLNELIERIEKLSHEFIIEGRGDETEESRSFDSDIELEEGKLIVNVNARFCYTEESND